MAVELLIILALVLGNGVLSGAEIAVLGVRGTRVKELVEGGSGAARALQRLRREPERFLATVQIGITVVGSTAGAFGGATLAEELAPQLARWSALAPVAPELALVLVVAMISYLSLVVGELVPKSVALKATEPYALALARPLLWLSQVARPLVWVLTASSNVLLFPLKDRASFTESRLSADELADLVDEAARGGMVDPHAGEIASRALELPALVAADVMVPRQLVVSLSRSASRDELRRMLLEHSHSRYPVVEGAPDRVVGYISIKDVLAVAWEEGLVVVDDLIRPAYFVAESKPAVHLLQELRTRRIAMAIVVNEAGGMVGIVTLEDLLEELVGEIVSEHARDLPEPMHRLADGTVLALGTVAIRDLNRALALQLPEGEWTTIAGLCLALSGTIPSRGTRLTTEGGVVLEVTEASPRRVHAVRLHVPKPADR